MPDRIHGGYPPIIGHSLPPFLHDFLFHFQHFSENLKILGNDHFTDDELQTFFDELNPNDRALNLLRLLKLRTKTLVSKTTGTRCLRALIHLLSACDVCELSLPCLAK